MGQFHLYATYFFAHNCCTISLSPTGTARIYSIQFELWSPLLHQHLHPHSTCHLNNKTYPPTPDLHWHQHLHLCIQYLLDSRIVYKQMSWSLCTAILYTTTFPVYPLLTTSTRTLYWIITNAFTTDTTWPSYSLMHYLLLFPNHNLGFYSYLLSCIYSPCYPSTH